MYARAWRRLERHAVMCLRGELFEKCINVPTRRVFLSLNSCTKGEEDSGSAYLHGK